jgi:hypothetical protein
MIPKEEYEFAEINVPSEVNRNIVCQNPRSAYFYALLTDKKSRDDTRKAACGDPFFAYWYAKNIDKHARDDTREAACTKSFEAYLYARDVDEELRIDTWLAVKNTEYENKYRKLFNDSIKELII